MPKAFASHTILVIEVIESHFECYAATPARRRLINCISPLTSLVEARRP